MAEVVLIKDVECAVVSGVKWDQNWNNDEQQWRQQRRQQSSQTANHHLCKLWIVTQEKLARRLLTQCGLPGSSYTLKPPSPWTGLFLCINNSSTVYKRRVWVKGAFPCVDIISLMNDAIPGIAIMRLPRHPGTWLGVICGWQGAWRGRWCYQWLWVDDEKQQNGVLS